MTNSTKMTKKDYFNTLLTIDAVKANADLVTFINHELDLLAKKNAAEKKPTANQVANKGYEAAILDFLADGSKHTVTDIQKGIDTDGTLSNQRVSAILRGMITAGQVVRSEDKRKAYFAKA